MLRVGVGLKGVEPRREGFAEGITDRRLKGQGVVVNGPGYLDMGTVVVWMASLGCRKVTFLDVYVLALADSSTAFSPIAHPCMDESTCINLV